VKVILTNTVLIAGNRIEYGCNLEKCIIIRVS
jgi:hypothetical protein